MEKSESIVNLATALNCFHKSVGKIKKTETNPFFKSKYADLSAILDAISEPLNENGLCVLQLPKGVNQLETILLHVSGEYISETYIVTPVKNDPQSLGSSITYQRRYALGAILSLNIDKDDDGNEASKQPETKPPKPTALEQRVILAKKVLDTATSKELLEKVYKSLDADLQKTNEIVKYVNELIAKIK
jgi:hypothetical protein